MESCRRAKWRDGRRLRPRWMHEHLVVALLDAAQPTLRLLARDVRALDPDWVFIVCRQVDVDTECAPPEILAAMRGLCPEEPVVALVPVQRFVDELTPEAACDARVLSFFEKAREPAHDGHLKVIVFSEGRYELVGAPFEVHSPIGDA